ncbi:MAG TPA: hypothetical protein VNN19_01455, partial [bacterium]|nr:hypothetical protein [bacterium]
DGAPPWQAARALALLGAGMAVGTWRLRSRPAIALALVMLTVLPVAGAIALSGSVDLFRVRGLLAAAGAPWALLVAGVLAGRVQGVPDAGVRLALGAALLAAIGSGTAHHATEGKEDWRGAAAFVAARAGPDDPIFFVHYAAQVAFDRYFHGPQPRIGLPQSFHWEEGYRAPYRVTPADVERVVPPALEVRRRAWVVLSHDAGRGSEHLLRVLDGWGERREDTMRRGVRVVGYSR